MYILIDGTRRIAYRIYCTTIMLYIIGLFILLQLFWFNYIIKALFVFSLIKT